METRQKDANVGEILRRYGLHLNDLRRIKTLVEQAALAALKGRRRGPGADPQEDREYAELVAELAQNEKALTELTLEYTLLKKSERSGWRDLSMASTSMATEAAIAAGLTERAACAAAASVVLGATVIEKHFSLRRADGGVDSTFSLEPAEMAQLVVETERAWQVLGRVTYGPTEAEKKSLQFRRSLYVVQDLKAGDVLTRENIRAIRPGLGLPTKYLEQVLGKTVKQEVKRGTALGWGMMG